MRKVDMLTLLQAPEQASGLDSPTRGEWRRPDLSVQPDQWLVCPRRILMIYLIRHNSKLWDPKNTGLASRRMSGFLRQLSNRFS